MSKYYELEIDDLVKADIRLLRFEKKAVVEEFEETLDNVQKRPKSYGRLDAKLKGYRKAKFKKIFRIIYSIDERAKRVILLIVGKRTKDEHDVYQRLSLRLQQKKKQSTN